MTGHLMPLVHNALHHLWGVLGKITRAEERGMHAVLLQHIKDAAGADLRDRHSLLQRKVNTMLARHVELFGIKT